MLRWGSVVKINSHDYLENHLYLSLTLDDKPQFFRDVPDIMNQLAEQGFCKPDWSNQIVYDIWGVGIRTGVGSFFSVIPPNRGKSN